MFDTEFKWFNGMEGVLDAKSKNQIEYEDWMIIELIKCKNSVVYFCKNYFKIFVQDQGGWVPWKDAIVPDSGGWTGMWDFQEEFLELLASDANVIAKWPRQVGKSTCTRAYLLWYILFNKEKTCLILANKEDMAIEQLELLKQSLYELPYWMQGGGIAKANIKSLTIGNKSRIIARATSKDAARGLTLAKVYCDEFAFIDDSVADPFFAAVYPTISTGKSASMIITSTPNGTNHFYRMWGEAESGKGMFQTHSIKWNARPDRTEAWAKKTRETVGDIKFQAEYMCEFHGSTATLLNSNYTAHLMKACATPIKLKLTPALVQEGYDSKIRMYEVPLTEMELEKNGWQYVACQDTAMGMKQDFSVLQIFLVKNSRNLRQVAVFSANDLDPKEFANKATILLRAYHNPSLIVEANGAGDVALEVYSDVYYYENLVNFDRSYKRRGLVPTWSSKTRAIIYLKAYLEKNLMKIVDRQTVVEASSYSKIGLRQWGNKGSLNDDHVTSMMWIPYYLNSPMYYGEIDEDEIENGTSLLDLPNHPSVIEENAIEMEHAKLLASANVKNRGDILKDFDKNCEQETIFVTEESSIELAGAVRV